MPGTTYAVSSDLTGEAYAAALAIWGEFEQRYGLTAARAAIHPHVTYVVGDCERPEVLSEHLAIIASTIAPFAVELEGVGVFERPQPVVHLRVAKSTELLSAFAAISAAMQAAGLRLWPYYAPGIWTPHVTLALQDTSPALLPALLADLAARCTHFTTRLEAAGLVHVLQPQHAYVGTFPFGGTAT
ncbi:MAG TPA: 2'-5' RNA ligase family protein [Roseiflexaceae bacterium]